MSPKKLLLQSTVCATALAGAYFAGRASSSNQTAPGILSLGQNKPAAVAGSNPGGPTAIFSANAGGTIAAGSTQPSNRPSSPTPEQASAHLKTIFENQDPVGRMTDFLAFLKTLDTNESRTAALGALMENFNPRERARELNMLMSQWADADPLAALTSVKDNKEWTGQMAAGTVLSKWVKTNPNDAIAWATENGKEANATETGNYYMVSVIGALAKTDLDRAATLAQTTMERSRARGDAMDRILDQYLGQRSPEATQTWAASLEQSPFKDGVMGRLAGRLADKDAASAAAWATQLPDTANKPRVMAEIVSRWSREQPNEAGAWLNQFPASTATDDPRESFAQEVKNKDPEAALAWVGTITDEKRRERASRDVIRSWIEREPALARQWVDASNQPDYIKQRYGTKPNG